VSDTTLRRLRRTRTLLAGAIGLAVLLILSRGLTGLYVDALWFGEVGYTSVFWKDLAWVWGVRAVMCLLVGGALFLNLRIVARSLGTLQIRRRFGNLEIAERLPERYIVWGVAGLSALLGLWFGASVPPGVARSALLLLNAGEWGMVDPFLGRDVGHYVFAVPLLRAGVTFGLVVSFLLLAVTLAGYATTGTFQLGQRGVTISPGARRHLGILLGVFLVLIAARFALGRSLLLLYGSSDVPGLFGYTDAAARSPGLRILAVLSVGAAIGVMVSAWKSQLLPLLVGIGALIVGGLGAGQVYPSLVQRFMVVPNELARETPYIEENIRFTRLGYGLESLTRDAVPIDMDAPVNWEAAIPGFAGLPVWSADALTSTFRELQAGFRYYDFSPPAVDRYPTPEGLLPVALSVREVNPGEIQDPNWQNLHIRERFVTGNGVVAVKATDRNADWGPVNLLTTTGEASPDLPEALALEQPRIVVGSRSQPYAVVSPTDSTFLAPDGSRGEAGADFPTGIGMSSLLRRLVVAWHLQETNFLFSTDVGPDSRLILVRSAMERVRRIAPFLRYPENPYPVVHDGRVVWVVEGFTATRYFPLSRPFELEFRRPVAYARNSVKVTVDAVTGETNFYVMPGEDPLIDAWASAFPGLFRPLEEMPGGLRDHLRYSQALLNLQSQVLLDYHQAEPQTFFGQIEQWALSQELSRTTSPVSYRPDYSVIQLPGDEEPSFQLTTVFVPAGRDNLTAMLAGRLREDGSQYLRLIDFPITRELRGPRQVETLVEQDPVISQQFSLWRTGGSSVWTGHLHVLPIGNRVLYMEPIFLAAEDDAIPELRRFVVSDGERVAMEETLAGAVASLAGESVRTALATALEAEEAGAVPPVSAARALELLDRAEARLRAGDFAGFGASLDELRAALERLSTGG
jgi:uncharacterized membrane protein (UPF0182 family)